MATPKKSKKIQKENTVEEVHLDALVINEKKTAPKLHHYKREDDEEENNWQDVPKKKS